MKWQFLFFFKYLEYKFSYKFSIVWNYGKFVCMTSYDEIKKCFMLSDAHKRINEIINIRCQKYYQNFQSRFYNFFESRWFCKHLTPCILDIQCLRAMFIVESASYFSCRIYTIKLLLFNFGTFFHALQRGWATR